MFTFKELNLKFSMGDTRNHIVHISEEFDEENYLYVYNYICVINI